MQEERNFRLRSQDIFNLAVLWLKLKSTVKRATSAPLTWNPFTAEMSSNMKKKKEFSSSNLNKSFDFRLFL